MKESRLGKTHLASQSGVNIDPLFCLWICLFRFTKQSNQPDGGLLRSWGVRRYRRRRLGASLL